MKRVLIIAYMVFGCAAVGLAQSMIINFSNGTKQVIVVSDINKLTFDLGATALRDNPVVLHKMKMALANICPNPFRANTRIDFTVSAPGIVHVQVCDAQGRVIRTLAREKMTLGNHSLSWDAKDNTGAKVSAGSYIVTIETAGTVINQKMLILNK